MKPTKAKFSVGQVVNKVLPGDPPLRVLVTIQHRQWAGHAWYYRVQYVDGGDTVWLLESQLAAPLVV